jgi:outer membrane protein TolC
MMMLFKKNVLLIYILPFILYAQDKIVLTLEQCIQIGQTKSPVSNIIYSEFEATQQDYNAFNAGLFPQLSLSMVSPQYNRSISQITLDDGTSRYVTRQEANTSLNLSLLQEIPWTGGSFTIRSGIERIDLFGDSKSFLWRSTPLILEYRQPIFQFNSLNWQRKLLDLQYRIARKRLHEDIEGVAMEISEYFFNFHLAKINLDNAQANFSVNDTIYTISKGRYQVGKIAENDLLQSELKLLEARSSLNRSQLDFKKAREDLRIHLGFPADMEIELIPPGNALAIEIDPDLAVEQARKNRSDPLDYTYRKLVSERNVDQARSNAGLSGSLTAGYGYNQSNNSNDISLLYKNPLDQQFFFLGFEIPLFTWGKGSAQIEAQRSRLQAVETNVKLNEEEFYESVYFQALEVAHQQNQVLLSAKSDTVAQRRFEVTKNRYLIGKIDITNMFIAQNEKDAARREYIDNQRRYWFAYYLLRQMTLYDFIENRPLISNE